MPPDPVVPPDNKYRQLKNTVVILLLVLFLCCSLVAAAGFQVSTTQPVNRSFATAATTSPKFSTTTPVPVQTAVKTTTAVPLQTAIKTPATLPLFATAKTTTAPVPVPTSVKAPLTLGTISPSFTFLPATTRPVQTARTTPVACPSGWVACNGVCYCGQCGYQCPHELGYYCRNGVCGKECAGNTGNGTEVSCNGHCANTSWDNANCGSCGHACMPGETCVRGLCSLSCKWLGEWNWYPVENEHAYCGSCTNHCPEYEACVNRACTCPQDASHTLCNGVCMDIMNDKDNCALCGRKCGSAQSCVNGACVDACPANQQFCDDHCYDKDYLVHCGDCDHDCFSLDGQPHILNNAYCNINQCFARCNNQMVNIDTSTEHCGYCNHACDPGETCRKGVCTCTDPDYVLCSDRCVNLSTDTYNCGYCYYSCHEERAYCQGGQCQPPCPEWTTWCGEECVGLGIDKYNCGSCGHVCDHMCVLGICI